MSLTISKTVALSESVSKLTDGYQQTEDFHNIRGISADTNYAWLTNGPHLQVIRTKTGAKVGSWTFGSLENSDDYDNSCRIVCIDEIQRGNGKSSLLVVGIEQNELTSLICLFNFISSKVIRAIQLDGKITSLCVIDSGYDIFSLSGLLRYFDGMVAVGTAGGRILIMDLCRTICDEASTQMDSPHIRNEMNPCLLDEITLDDLNEKQGYIHHTIDPNYHLALHLNAAHESPQYFVLKNSKEENVLLVNKEEVIISGLHYCHQLRSLLIGYNFGAFQLYDLTTLMLVYTSPVSEEHIPITHFAIQEPADDPKAFCYIWAVYDRFDYIPLAVMYAFCYKTKEFHEGYGTLYQDFNYATVRFQMELKSSYRRNIKAIGGQCLQLNVIEKGHAITEHSSNEITEDNLSTCIFIWSIFIKNRYESEDFCCIFDLNQWYKEQMPSVSNQNSSTFMVQYCISDLLKNDQRVLAANLLKSSLQQFIGAQKLEEHYCPNSLSFELCVLSNDSISFLQSQGVQKSLLAHIESTGSLCLIEPYDIYQQIVNLGLVPLFIDIPTNSPITSIQQREIILGTALEQRLIGWLCKCASEWGNNTFLSSGCSIDFIISWAFQRALVLKDNCDSICIPLFDYSETRLDTRTNVLLNNCTRQFKNLCSLYSFVTTKLLKHLSNPALVFEQFKTLQIITTYFEVLQWLLNVGLLPECPMNAAVENYDTNKVCVPFPSQLLIDAYKERRDLLKTANKKGYSFSKAGLFIDTLIENEFPNNILQEQWRKDGGNGLYPPSSLQALLRTYLIDGDLLVKHSVVLYMFLDLAMVLDEERFQPIITHLIKFPAVFKVKPSIIKLTQGYWQLDHGNFNTAMTLLLDPLISMSDLKPWHHKVVLKFLLIQNEHNFALLYLKLRKPCLKDDEDILTAISLYVATGLIDEAFYFGKNYGNHEGKDKFLVHLFNEALKTKQLRSMLYHSFDPDQEKLFLNCLSNNPESKNYYVYYHILRSNYIELFDYDREIILNKYDLEGIADRCNASIDVLKRILPEISKNFLDLIYNKDKSSMSTEATDIAPLSASINNGSINNNPKMCFTSAAILKSKQVSIERNNPIKIATKDVPFIRIPTNIRSNKRKWPTTIEPTFIDNWVDNDVADPPAAKKMKLSPNVSCREISTNNTTINLNTPIVKRKPIREMNSISSNSTPHSILKVKHLEKPDISNIEVSQNIENMASKYDKKDSKRLSKQRTRLSSRRPLSKSNVRFEETSNLSPIKADLSISQSPSKVITKTETHVTEIKKTTVKLFSETFDSTSNLTQISNTSQEADDMKMEVEESYTSENEKSIVYPPLSPTLRSDDSNFSISNQGNDRIVNSTPQLHPVKRRPIRSTFKASKSIEIDKIKSINKNRESVSKNETNDVESNLEATLENIENQEQSFEYEFTLDSSDAEESKIDVDNSNKDINTTKNLDEKKTDLKASEEDKTVCQSNVLFESVANVTVGNVETKTGNKPTDDASNIFDNSQAGGLFHGDILYKTLQDSKVEQEHSLSNPQPKQEQSPSSKSVEKQNDESKVSVESSKKESDIDNKQEEILGRKRTLRRYSTSKDLDISVNSIGNSSITSTASPKRARNTTNVKKSETSKLKLRSRTVSADCLTETEETAKKAETKLKLRNRTASADCLTETEENAKKKTSRVTRRRVSESSLSIAESDTSIKNIEIGENSPAKIMTRAQARLAKNNTDDSEDIHDISKEGQIRVNRRLRSASPNLDDSLNRQASRRVASRQLRSKSVDQIPESDGSLTKLGSNSKSTKGRSKFHLSTNVLPEIVEENVEDNNLKSTRRTTRRKN